MFILIGSGKIFLIVFLSVLVICTIAFPLIKRNKIFGIRVAKSFESEEIWHKIHMIAAVVNIPFIGLLVLLLFANNDDTKYILGFLILIILLSIYLALPNLSTKQYFKEKELRERKEIEERIKKESGWR